MGNSAGHGDAGAEAAAGLAAGGRVAGGRVATFPELTVGAFPAILLYPLSIALTWSRESCATILGRPQAIHSRHSPADTLVHEPVQ